MTTITEPANLIARNDTPTVCLLEIGFPGPLPGPGSGVPPSTTELYLSGHRSHITDLCPPELPAVRSLLARALADTSAERVVVRLRVTRPLTPASRSEAAPLLPPAGIFGRLYHRPQHPGAGAAALESNVRDIPKLRSLWDGRPPAYDGATVDVISHCGECEAPVVSAVAPYALPENLTCPGCPAAPGSQRGRAPAAGDGVPGLTLTGLRLLVGTGIFPTLLGHSAHSGGRHTVGAYNPDWRAVVHAENTTPLTVSLPENVRLAVDCPPRHGYVARDDTLFRIASDVLAMPRNAAMLGFAQGGYGYQWCMYDNTVLCGTCVEGVSLLDMYAMLIDYYHFSEEVAGLTAELSRLSATYVEHCLSAHPQSALCQVMDSFMVSTQAAYLDVLHPKATAMAFGPDEEQALRYRIVNNGARVIAQLTLLEGTHTGAVTESDIDGVSMLLLSIHDAGDRRYDNYANEAYNAFNIVAAHHGGESAEPLGRFCTDVLAWAVDQESQWPLLAAGRYLLWQIHSLRYETARLLDHLTRTPHTPGDPYRDPALNALNPLLRNSPAPDGAASHPVTDDTLFSVRSRTRNPTWYDTQLADCRAHFTACPDCSGFDTATWQDRFHHVTRAYRSKHAGDCHCLNTQALYTSLALLEQHWWAASHTTAYTGTTADWNPHLC